MTFLSRLLLIPIALFVCAALVVIGIPSPQVALFVGWLLCAIACVLVVAVVPKALMNEVGRVDAGQLFTITWFVILVSAMGAGSLWNIRVWSPEPEGGTLAFVKIPADIWVLAGITLTANAGVRIAFALSTKPDKLTVKEVASPLGQVLTSPLNNSGSPEMGIAQYLLFNLMAVVVYMVAIARLFYLVTAGPLPEFPSIPAQVLTLMGVSAGGLVITNAVPKP